MAKETVLKNELKTNVLEMIKELFASDYDVLTVGTHEITIPMCDSERNDRFVNIVVKIPSGSYEIHDGVKCLVPYDGYEESENYKFELAEKEEKAKKKAEEKAKKMVRDKVRREKEKEIKVKKGE